MFMNSYYLGYDDISCDERARGIGCICERANECNDEKESTTVLVTSSTKANEKRSRTQVAITQTLPVTTPEAIHSTISTKKHSSKELPETPATSQTPGNKVSTHTLIQTIPGNAKSSTKNQ